MKKLVFYFLISVMVVASGCSSHSSIQGSKQTEANQAIGETEHGDAGLSRANELIVAGQEIPVALDPVQPLTTAYLRHIGAAEALFKVSADGEVEPELAESATEVDSTTWDIKLRPEARFWSGKAVDADAVIASLERSRELDLQAQPFLEGMTFTNLDKETLRIVTVREHMPVPLNLSYYQTAIHNAEAKHDAVETMDMTGMYKVTEFVPKQKMVLEINDNYWGDKPRIAKVVFEEIADEQTRALSVLSGRSHIALNINPSSLAQFQNNDKAGISAAPAANTQTVYLNLKQPQLADVRVRQALSWGLDREELVILGAEGQSVPVTTWLSSNPAYAEARTAVYPHYDAEKAGRLLDDAGWVKGSDGIRYKDGSPLTLRLMTWGGDKALGEALQNQWTDLGVKAEVRHGDYSLIETARETGDWDASIEAWSTFGDEYALLAGQYAAEGRGNYGGYDDEQTTELLSRLSAASDNAARRELALRINERVAEQAPVISLFPRPQLTAVSKSLQGFEEHFRQFENIVNANMTLD
ncbi:ABC transporter substrate-binding protein [Paenibacillaceae bacterium WGS1546]|uniref:ABC transporter substrate-binding protein n=1 Tax=Cohnella sp. WGS1546 TaxID=3366810 RepID=UPI00372D14B3